MRIVIEARFGAGMPTSLSSATARSLRFPADMAGAS